MYTQQPGVISKMLIMQIQQKLYKFIYYSLLQATNTMQN